MRFLLCLSLFVLFSCSKKQEVDIAEVQQNCKNFARARAGWSFDQANVYCSQINSNYSLSCAKVAILFPQNRSIASEVKDCSQVQSKKELECALKYFSEGTSSISECSNHKNQKVSWLQKVFNLN